MRHPLPFPLGRTVATAAVARTFSTGELAMLLRRHLHGDPGLLCQDDVDLNVAAVEHGDQRVFSKYDTGHGPVYVITEADRSSTTVLFPDEY